MPAESAAADELVRHEPENHRFALSYGAGLAVLEYRDVGPRAIDYHHTYVPPALRGRGIASRLAAFALRYAMRNGLEVIPTCPFVAAFVRRHPEYAGVLAPR